MAKTELPKGFDEALKELATTTKKQLDTLTKLAQQKKDEYNKINQQVKELKSYMTKVGILPKTTRKKSK